MKMLREFCTDLWGNEEGATVVEYAVLIALIIAACLVVIGTLSSKIQSAFQEVADQIS